MRILGHALPLLLAAGAAQAVELDGAARVWLGGGIDTNPRRDTVGPGDKTPTDAVLQGVVQLDGALRGERGGLLVSYDIGGRTFILLPSEDTLVQNGSLEGELFLIRGFSIGANLHLRDRRGAQRDYTDLGADAFLRLLVQSRLDVRASIGAHRFIFRPYFPASFWGPDLGFQARFRVNRRHSLVAFFGYESRTFNDTARADPEAPPPPEPPPEQRRMDAFFNVGVGYQYRGPWAFGASYSFIESDSNSFAQSVRRHSFSVHAGVQLFWKLSLFGNAVFQIIQYPNGLYLPPPTTAPDQPGIFTLESDDTGPHVSLRLVRPLGEWFEIDFRWQLFFGFLNHRDPSGAQQEQLSYFRQTFTLGAAFRIGSD